MTRFHGAFAPCRELARTGFIATTLGIGDLADRALGKDACIATLRRALDAGLNVVDTAPMYEDGFSEEVVGAALAGRRDGVFVIDKIDELDAEVGPQVDASVARLGFAPDAFVFHAVSTMEAWRSLAEGKGGRGFSALEGRVRFRGVSSHHPDVVRAAIDSGLCDVVMFPIGPLVDPRYEPLVEHGRSRGVATVCFKTFGAGKLVADSEGYGRPSAKEGLPKLSVRECVHATLTIGPDVALLGLSTPEEQDEAFEAALAFASTGPLTQAALASVKQHAVLAAAEKGRLHWNP
jgi:1-deoxyxylulose-5-phosphate synthase